MAKRFEYKRMTPDELREGLQTIGMPHGAFCRVFGLEPQRLNDFLSGDRDIPMWVPISIAMMARAPGALPEARQEAAERIIRDKARPQDGEYPYLAKIGDE